MRTFAVAFVGGIVGTVFTSMLVIAWTGPTSAPPNGNVSAPVNVGSTDQVKNGGLALNSLAVFGNAILSGTSRYLNFGTQAGASGYGFRDNAGQMQFKDSGGSWRSLAGSSSAAGVTCASLNSAFPAGISYFVPTTTDTACPYSYGSVLTINGGNCRATQIYTGKNGAGVWYRGENCGPWSAWRKVDGGGSGGDSAVPSGAIMAFDATTCPNGWSEYTQARGRFLRGIDNGAGNDPSGTRAPGSIQQDAFQGHKHFNTGALTYVGDPGGGVDDGPGWPRNQYANSAGTYDAGYGTPRVATETRPKNVAVLFCRKN